MDDMATRAIIIGVNIFVTITIVTLILMMFNELGGVYGLVKNTETSISSRFSDIYSVYNGKSESGLGLLNTLKKFEDEGVTPIVIIYPSSTEIKEYITNYNIGRKEENKITESRYLKIMMEKSKLSAENFKNQYGENYDTLKLIGDFAYEDKYDVQVLETEQGLIMINYFRVSH